MDHNLFDHLTRTLVAASSRRGLVRALTGGLALAGLPLGIADTDAKKKKGHKKKQKTPTPTPTPLPDATCAPRCRRKQCGDDGCGGSCGSCPVGQVCASGTCCTPEPTEETCAMECGYASCPRLCGSVSTPGSCGAVACTCPSGEECQGNGNCAMTCSPTTANCPSRCSCFASTESPGLCFVGGMGECPYYTQVCTTSAECPAGYSCQKTMCGPGPNGSPENRCWPICGLFGL